MSDEAREQAIEAMRQIVVDPTTKPRDRIRAAAAIDRMEQTRLAHEAARREAENQEWIDGIVGTNAPLTPIVPLDTNEAAAMLQRLKGGNNDSEA